MPRYETSESKKLDEEALRLTIKVIEETQRAGEIIEQMKKLLKEGGKKDVG